LNIRSIRRKLLKRKDKMAKRIKKKEIDTYSKARKMGFSEKESLKVLEIHRLIKQERKKKKKR